MDARDSGAGWKGPSKVPVRLSTWWSLLLRRVQQRTVPQSCLPGTTKFLGSNESQACLRSLGSAASSWEKVTFASMCPAITSGWELFSSCALPPTWQAWSSWSPHPQKFSAAFSGRAWSPGGGLLVKWRAEQFDQRHQDLVLVLQSLAWSSLALLCHSRTRNCCPYCN